MGSSRPHYDCQGSRTQASQPAELSSLFAGAKNTLKFGFSPFEGHEHLILAFFKCGLENQKHEFAPSLYLYLSLSSGQVIWLVPTFRYTDH